jgi:probable rRNA maturation factor
MPNAINVWVHWTEAVAPALEDAWIERVVRQAIEADGRLASAGVVEVAALLADDQTLHALNKQFRRVDRPTDVLAFEGGAEQGTERGAKRGAEQATPASVPRHLGDIAVSVERARRQAEEYGHSFEREMAYLLVHGTLPLWAMTTRQMTRSRPCGALRRRRSRRSG